ncbi:type II toxin-antitoxin system HicA family toxin [Pseudomonas fluorescens]|uniref:type II toxin-antitoxin system HicA family toxin n=1 Tax=Pseudomonas fluorescens TaxID=294 RepID=UPI002860B6B1|nr:type II toxin-antitoxin system HicA family toxin [Pseudomonas fluorescens]MDR6163252.1 putative RNA binding protein YcfA (HicA-like mRNA interferase family) [Pseudomonas fluorescens]
MQSRLLMKELEEAGWTLDLVAGSHHIFTHRYNPNTIAVPHPKKDLPLGTVTSIRRRAGLFSPPTRHEGDP